MMKCWGLEVMHTFVLCMGATGMVIGTWSLQHRVEMVVMAAACVGLSTAAYVTRPTFLRTGYWPFHELTAFMLMWVVRQGSRLPPEISDLGCSCPTIASAVAVSWQGQLSQSNWDIFSTFSCTLSSYVWWTTLTAPGTDFPALLQDV